MDVSYSNISSLTGIEFFTAIQLLYCNNNQLTSLDVSNNILLTTLSCEYNQLTSLDVSSNTALITFGCGSNQLTSLDVSSNTSLIILYCFNNQLTSLNLSSNIVLYQLVCSGNQITSLNLSSNIALTQLYCSDNQLTSLLIKNGLYETALDFSYNPNLSYICADESQITDVQTKINTYGYATTCNVNSYCSFTSGGSYYTIQGNNKFDLNNNGCDPLDIQFSNLKFIITDGTISGSFISNNLANYSIPVQAGIHTITPVLQNPTYFYVSPTTATITFPATASPAIQDFCITANGVHNDLEITVLPIAVARPGFDANYKIVYNNKGTQTQSGTINLTFDDAVLDFVSATPATTSQSLNNLNWNFTNLLPFEKREILVTLNANSPMETPPLNAGNILNFTATITAAIDETPADNVSILNQTVVNSFDPNDKTCLEGNNIAPAKVGDYVHYMIRFENTGTFPAQNIVVKDIIDTTKYDIATLIPVSSSHDFVTKISDTNKV